MKILQVNKFLYPKGGAEIVCLGLSEELRRDGHEVFHFGMADSRNTVGEDADCFPAEMDYHAERSLGRKLREAARTIYGVEARRGMEKLLDRRRPDIIHAHNIYHQLTPSILAPARKRGIPVLLTLHDYKLLCPVYTFLRDGLICEKCLHRGPEPILAHRCKGGFSESLVLWAEDRLHRLLGSYEKGVTLFTSPSRFLLDKMVEGRLDRSRIEYLPNALPFSMDILERSYQAPPPAQKPELLWVGRMSHEKGLGTLLHALALSQADLKLTLAGDGPQEAPLRELARELKLGGRVEFLGRVPRETVAELILRSHGTILPSEWYENAPLSLLESLALGRPVIGSGLGGIPEMLDDGVTGWIYPAGDRQALGKLLDQWANDETARLDAGHEAWRIARERYHPGRILEATLGLYRRLIGK